MGAEWNSPIDTRRRSAVFGGIIGIPRIEGIFVPIVLIRSYYSQCMKNQQKEEDLRKAIKVTVYWVSSSILHA